MSALLTLFIVLVPVYVQADLPPPSAQQINATTPEVMHHSVLLLDHLDVNFDDGSDGNFVFAYSISQPKTPEIMTHGIVDGHYQIVMDVVREWTYIGSSTYAHISSPPIDPRTTEFLVDILGKNIKGEGGEALAGGTVGYGIIYDLDNNEEKSILVRTHTRDNKPSTVFSYINDTGSVTSPTVTLNDIALTNTWKSVTGDVKSMYEDNGLGDYDSDVESWRLYLGGSTYTSQINGRSNSFTGQFDNILITPKVTNRDLQNQLTGMQKLLTDVLERLDALRHLTLEVTQSIPDDITTQVTSYNMTQINELFSATLYTPHSPVSAITLEFTRSPITPVFVEISAQQDRFRLDLDSDVTAHMISFSRPVTYEQVSITVDNVQHDNVLEVGLAYP